MWKITEVFSKQWNIGSYHHKTNCSDKQFVTIRAKKNYSPEIVIFCKHYRNNKNTCNYFLAVFIYSYKIKAEQFVCGVRDECI